MFNVSALDDDDVDLANEVGVLHQGNAQIGVVLAAVVFAQADHIGFIPSCQYSFDDAGFTDTGQFLL